MWIESSARNIGLDLRRVVLVGAAGDKSCSGEEDLKALGGAVGLSSWSSFPSRPPQTVLVWMVGAGIFWGWWDRGRSRNEKGEHRAVGAV